MELQLDARETHGDIRIVTGQSEWILHKDSTQVHMIFASPDLLLFNEINQFVIYEYSVNRLNEYKIVYISYMHSQRKYMFISLFRMYICKNVYVHVS